MATPNFTSGVEKKKSTDGHAATVRPAVGDDDARVWLRANEYSDIADQIDQVLLTWKEQGKATRRNWWEILAGGKDGHPRVAGGVTFPVLRAARIRQNLPADVPNAICRNPTEQAPRVRVTPRWRRKRRRSGRRAPNPGA